MSGLPKKSLFRRAASFPFFLPLAGIYPVLFLLAANRSQTALSAAGFSLLLSLSAALLIAALCLLLVRPRSRAYLAALALDAAFFSYGHLFNLIDGRYIGSFLIGRHLLFFPLFLLVFLGLLFGLLKRPAPAQSPAPWLNLVLLGLCLFQIIPVAFYLVSTGGLKQQAPGASTAQPAGDANGPDIYYIILDGMVREDLMRGPAFGYTDYSLPEDLAARGFVIPQCAFSNYNATATSVTSALNFDYLDTLGVPDDQVNNEVNDPPVLYNLLHHNRTVAYLKSRGYQFVSFRGFFPLNDFKEADVYYNFFENKKGFDELSERNFRELFVRTTLMRLPSELYKANPGAFPFVPQAVAQVISPDSGVFSSRSYQWYQQHLYTFDMLENIPALPGKKFIYAHLYTTHQPYVLNPDGSLLWPINENNDGYIASARYTSRRILEVVDRILSESKVPPVIIIQADHGHGLAADRNKILNAYFLPGGGARDIYPAITPVNTFRVVLDRYAGGNFDLLPDTILVTKAGQSSYARIPASCQVK